jgi:ATP-dependent Clp protease ATP-binding subunit ClpC
VFHSLNEKNIAKIVELQLEQVQTRLMEQKVHLEIADSAKKYLAKKGFDENYGARPLKRLIQTEILDELAMNLIEKKFKNGDKIKVSASKNKIVLEK